MNSADHHTSDFADVLAEPRTATDPRPEIVPPDAAPSADEVLALIVERLEEAPNYGTAPRVSIETRRVERAHQWRARAASDGRRWTTPWCDALHEALEELLSMVPYGPPKL